MEEMAFWTAGRGERVVEILYRCEARACSIFLLRRVLVSWLYHCTVLQLYLYRRAVSGSGRGVLVIGATGAAVVKPASDGIGQKFSGEWEGRWAEFW